MSEKVKLTKKQILDLANALNAKQFSTKLPKNRKMVAYSWSNTYGHKTAILFVYAGDKIGITTDVYAF